MRRKCCYDCGRALPLSDFHWHTANGDCRQTQCKQCHKRRMAIIRGTVHTQEIIRLRHEQLAREAWLGRHFLQLLAGAQFCTLCNLDDSFRVEVTDVRGKQRSCEEQDVRDLLLAALGVELTKQCHGPCGRTLPLSAFGHDKNKPDGRLLRCKRCEAERVRAYKGKKR